MHALSTIRYTVRKNLLFAAGLALMLGLSGLAGMRVAHVAAADCDQNAIIYCGTGSASQFIAQVRQNDSKNGHHDLQTVYAYYGLEPASYDKFVAYSRPGTAYKDGRIVVDGQVVATNSRSIGRLASAQGPGYFSQNIGGTTYYGNASSVVFQSNSIPVMAMFNSQGVLQFAVLTSCGNPITGSLVTPSYSCNLLQHTPVSGKLNTYSFTTSASAANNAAISKLVYTFGDGSPSVTTTSASQPVVHTFTRGGTFTVRVTVYVHLPGNQEVQVTSGGCAWQVKVVLPFYQCIQTLATVDPQNKYHYNFTTSTRADNGAGLAKLIYNFGDGTTATSVAGNGAISHVYKNAGTYTVKATGYFNVTGQNQRSATSAGCQTELTVVKPYYQCLQLSGSFIDQSKFSYHFVAAAHYGNGAKLVSGDFDFGDGTKVTGIKSNDSGQTVTADHTYAQGGNYNIAATLHFSVNGQTVTAPACNAYVTPTTPPTPECKPGIAVGSPLCSPCEYNPSLPAGSPECVPPVLPNTGAGNVIALFSVAVVGGFLVYRQVIFRRHKAAFLAADRGTSPVLDQSAPMGDAPEAKVGHPYRSLRRRRPF